MMILIGSAALKRHYPWYTRNIGSLDVMATHSEARQMMEHHLFKGGRMVAMNGNNKVLLSKNGLIGKIYIGWHSSTNRDFLNATKCDSLEDVEVRGLKLKLATIDMLYAIKMAHYFKDTTQYIKNRRDVMFLRSVGASVPDVYRPWVLECRQSHVKSDSDT